MFRGPFPAADVLWLLVGVSSISRYLYLWWCRGSILFHCNGACIRMRGFYLFICARASPGNKLLARQVNCSTESQIDSGVVAGHRGLAVVAYLHATVELEVCVAA